MSQQPPNPSADRIEEAQWLDLVVRHVQSLRLGVVEIVVHDSRVIQIEKTERVRLDQKHQRP